MTSTVEKRCTCAEAKWPKCDDPWYLKKFRWKRKSYAPNLTRYAQLFTPDKDLTTKTDAEALADVVRSAIRAGTYVSAKVQQTTVPVQAAAGGTVTQAIAAFDKAVITCDVHKRDQTKSGDRHHLAQFAAFKLTKTAAPLSDQPLNLVTIDHLIAFRNSPRLIAAANSTWAKYRTTLAQFFAWAMGEGHLTANPFKTARPDQLRQLRRGKGRRRSRRIYADEEAALLRAAGHTPNEYGAVRLQALIIAAIETGMRKGELLALLWADVNLPQRMIYVRAEEVGASKTGDARPIPISQRLYDELELLKLDPTGKLYPRSAYVFGDVTGGRIKGVDKAWETAVLRAYGHAVVWVNTALSPASRAQLAAVDLHFHDLRHEAGSRWLESKAFDLGQISTLYGHTTVAQTATYLHAASQNTKAAMAEYDAHCKRQAQLAKAANAGSDDGSGVHKLSTNGRGRHAATTGPRLVKGSKPRGSM